MTDLVTKDELYSAGASAGSSFLGNLLLNKGFKPNSLMSAVEVGLVNLVGLVVKRKTGYPLSTMTVSAFNQIFIKRRSTLDAPAYMATTQLYIDVGNFVLHFVNPVGVTQDTTQQQATVEAENDGYGFSP